MIHDTIFPSKQKKSKENDHVLVTSVIHLALHYGSFDIASPQKKNQNRTCTRHCVYDLEFLQD